MAKRLIDWRTINSEKIKRSRSWIFGELAAGRFPPPVVQGRGSNLWDESDIDRWMAEFIAREASSATRGAPSRAKTSRKPVEA